MGQWRRFNAAGDVRPQRHAAVRRRSAAPMHVVHAARVLTERVLHRYTLRMCRVPMPPAILGLTAPTRPPTMRIAYSGQTPRCRLAGLVPGGAYIIQFQATGAASQRQSPLPEVVLVSAHSRGAARALADGFNSAPHEQVPPIVPNRAAVTSRSLERAIRMGGGEHGHAAANNVTEAMNAAGVTFREVRCGHDCPGADPVRLRQETVPPGQGMMPLDADDTGAVDVVRECGTFVLVAPP